MCATRPARGASRFALAFGAAGRFRGIMLRRLDYPPVWLLGALVSAWMLGRLWAPAWGGTHATALGWLLVMAALGLIVLAVATLLRQGTSIVPHRDPDALVCSGPYRISRNPIYLADLGLLAGAILIWHAWLALPLIPILAHILLRRFIKPEEARLCRRFGTAAQDYLAATRRWI